MTTLKKLIKLLIKKMTINGIIKVVWTFIGIYGLYIANSYITYRKNYQPGTKEYYDQIMNLINSRLGDETQELTKTAIVEMVPSTLDLIKIELYNIGDKILLSLVVLTVLAITTLAIGYTIKFIIKTLAQGIANSISESVSSATGAITDRVKSWKDWLLGRDDDDDDNLRPSTLRDLNEAEFRLNQKFYEYITSENKKIVENINSIRTDLTSVTNVQLNNISVQSEFRNDTFRTLEEIRTNANKVNKFMIAYTSKIVEHFANRSQENFLILNSILESTNDMSGILPSKDEIREIAREVYMIHEDIYSIQTILQEKKNNDIQDIFEGIATLTDDGKNENPEYLNILLDRLAREISSPIDNISKLISNLNGRLDIKHDRLEHAINERMDKMDKTIAISNLTRFGTQLSGLSLMNGLGVDGFNVDFFDDDVNVKEIGIDEKEQEIENLNIEIYDIEDRYENPLQSAVASNEHINRLRTPDDIIDDLRIALDRAGDENQRSYFSQAMSWINTNRTVLLRTGVSAIQIIAVMAISTTAPEAENTLTSILSDHLFTSA